MSLWFLARSKSDPRYRKRQGETLFIYAAQMGNMTDRTHRELSASDIEKIAATYRAWRGDEGFGLYRDEPEFCASADLREMDRVQAGPARMIYPFLI